MGFTNNYRFTICVLCVCLAYKTRKACFDRVMVVVTVVVTPRCWREESGCRREESGCRREESGVGGRRVV